MTPVRVYILASTTMARTGMRKILEENGTRVIGEGDGSEASEFGEADVVLVDGEELLEEIADAGAEGGAQALVVISEDDRPLQTLQSLPLRGWGIVMPDASPEELDATVTAVAEGLVVLPRLLTERVLHSAEAEDLDEPLTNREREVLELLAQGLSNKLIAKGLRISEHTVKFHISSLYAKLGVSSRAEAVSQGARYGLLSL